MIRINYEKFLFYQPAFIIFYFRDCELYAIASQTRQQNFYSIYPEEAPRAKSTGLFFFLGKAGARIEVWQIIAQCKIELIKLKQTVLMQ